ncbi:MAG: radical SAM protein [Dehalococcoidales bacterium]|nr:radical SAM protein [Dehalococcoidales bacterium]
MFKIALINPSQSAAYSQPPLGLALIGAVLEREGYQVNVVEANVLKLQPEDVVPLVGDADVVGLTAMTPTINMAAAIARHLKKAYPDLPIILGGAHATLLPKETLIAAPEVDIIINGEGEETIKELLRALENKQPLVKVNGISYRKDNGVVINPARLGSNDLDSLPFLAYHLLPWRKYRPHPPHGRALPFAAIITSRGCPYRCSYCSKPIFGNKFRSQSPDRVVEEVAYLNKRFGIKEFAFYDDVFTLDKKRAHDIADGIIRKGLKIYWTCETRVNLIDKELLRHIRQAGCYSIAYGIESGSPEILSTLDKGISLEQVEEAIRLSREADLQTIGYFMIGSPGESPQTIRQTIQLAKKLKLDFAQFAVTTPFPGTKLYELYLEGKKDANIPWESFVYAGSGREVTPVFDSSLLSREDIQCWARRAYREFYLRPSYWWQRIRNTTSLGDLKVGFRGLSMLAGNIRKG